MDDMIRLLIGIGSIAVCTWMYFTGKRQDFQDRRIEALMELYNLLKKEVFDDEDEDDDHTGEDRGSGASDGTTSPPTA